MRRSGRAATQRASRERPKEKMFLVPVDTTVKTKYICSKKDDHIQRWLDLLLLSLESLESRPVHHGRGRIIKSQVSQRRGEVGDKEEANIAAGC